MKNKIGIITCAFAILTIFLSSCKKKGQEISFDFSITIQDYYNESPIQDVSVSAYTKGVSSGTYTNTFQLQASESTSSAGVASFQVPYGGIEVIKLSIEKDGYFGQSIEYNPDDFSTEGNNALTIPIKKKGFISIRIQNTSPFSAFDEITFNTINNDCEECTDFNSLVLAGTQIDTTLSGITVGNRYFKYQYIVFKNGASSNYLDSALCVNDTTFININY
ncbi:MAG: hypothetical protein H6599_03640 [Flavobacteriales bacterium]|nr:hypothetical protein [Flavobacteriales bacterium]